MGWKHQPCQKGLALTFDHGMNTSTMSERLSTYILPWDEHINHVRKAQHLYLTMGWTHQPCKKGSTLISDHGMNTSTMSEGINTYIWSWDEHINHVRKAQHLYLIMWDEHIPQSHQNGSALISDHVGWTHPAVTSEWISTYIWPWDEHINHVKKAHWLITSLCRESRSREHQDSPWSIQTSL